MTAPLRVDTRAVLSPGGNFKGAYMINKGKIKWSSAPRGATHAIVLKNGFLWEKFENDHLHTWTGAFWKKDGAMDLSFMDKSSNRMKRPGS